MKALPYGRHWLEEEEVAGAVRALRSEWLTQGPLIPEFEEAVAARCGARFGVAFSSGTAALHAACFAAGIGPSDEVITSALTFVASSNAVVYQGGSPVLCDIDPETFLLDPADVRRRITPRTKAIIPVHFGGLPCPMEPISELAKDHGLLVIEDACHAFGAEWISCQGKRERVGGCHASDMAVFSFHPVKHITTGEGGMVLTNRGDLADRLRVFRHHGIVRNDPMSEEPWRYEMRDLGYNYRITDFQCALGLAQLKKLDRFLHRRREIAVRYGRAFADLGLRPQKVTDGGEGHAWHLYAVQLLPERLKTDRRTLFRELRRRGLGVNVHYLPVHLHPFYQRRFSYRSGDFPLAERYYEQALTLPLFPRMTEEETDWVVQTVRSVFQEYGRAVSMAVPTGMRPA